MLFRSMNWLIQLSWGAFFGVKFAVLAMAVGLAEWYRRRNPLFVRRWLRAGESTPIGELRNTGEREFTPPAGDAHDWVLVLEGARPTRQTP